MRLRCEGGATLYLQEEHHAASGSVVLFQILPKIRDGKKRVM